jgi:lon-related putative ATP-dependent protease
MSQQPHELASSKLCSPCDLTGFDFDTTAALPGEVSIIGQDRAVHAIDFGVGIASFGFNIYALGSTGTGRATTIHTLLERIATNQPVPQDWVYVNNFSDANQPNAISLPPGMAVELRRDMEELVDDLLREIPRIFEGKEYEQQKEGIVREMQEQRSEAFSELERTVSARGFTLLQTARGLGLAPILNGQVITPEEYQQLDEPTRKSMEESQRSLQTEMAGTMRRVRELEKDTRRRLQGFDKEIAFSAVSPFIDDLMEKHGHLDEIPEYLQAVQADIVDHVQGFRSEEEPPEALAASMKTSQRDALLKRYTVNVIVDHSQQAGAPVIFQPNPTYSNLLGRIEHRAEFGALITDFTMIKPGCLHRANGGYLVVEMQGLMTNPLAWDALKRALKNQTIQLDEAGSQLRVVSTVTLEPEAIPLDLKVVLIGDPLAYYLLHEHDEDFRKLFKVQADFGTEFERTPETCMHYAQFVAARCHQENLPHFEPQAVGRIVEHGSRLAGHQAKLSTRFGDIADLVREASYWARRSGHEQTTAEDVQFALDAQTQRANRAEERLQDMIDEGAIRVVVDGEAVGQVNGLAVLSLGNYSFGKPSRITVRTYTGRSGVVSLDREAKMSGRIYDKGLLTLTGYLGGKYALKNPLSLSATISFEQLYDGIEGDSASSTELYALLSSLSGLPLKQGLAVTGSVDQQGNVQPIGGVNEKIEGFFSTCSQRGLTGEQGVLIPAQNVVNLMLKAEIIQAVDEGRFRIFAVRTIDEGLKILTGVPAGEMQEDGSYPADSVHERVTARLEEISENLKAKDQSGPEETEQDGTSETMPAPGQAPKGTATGTTREA